MAEWIADLERLRALRDDGTISDEEFQASKARVLGAGERSGPAPASVTAAPTSHDLEPEIAQPEWTDYGAIEDSFPRSPLYFVPLLIAIGLVLGGLWWFLREPVIAGRVATVTGASLNCRAAPGTSSAVQETLPAGTQLTLGKTEDGWAEATGRDCWVKESRLTATAIAARPPAAEKDQVSLVARSSNTYAGIGPEYVSSPVGSVDRSQRSLLLHLCPSISTEIKWPFDKPTYHSGFYGDMRNPGLYQGVEANGSYWSNPRVSGSSCLIDIASSGVVNGNSYSWAKTCEVSTLTVADDHRVAFRQFDPSTCS